MDLEENSFSKIEPDEEQEQEQKIENIVIPQKKSTKAAKRVSLRVMIKTKLVLNSTTGWVCYHRADIERDLEHCCVLLSTAASWQHQWSQQAPYSCCS